jgi:hypothetical protein
MRCTLVVPGLLDWPSSALASLAKQAPALSRLVDADAAPSTEPDGALAAACRACGIAKQQDWPAAPWLARAAGIATDEAYWLCADPVHFLVGASELRLGGAVADLDAADAHALLAMLNAHFAVDRIGFLAPTPAHWLLRAEEAPRLVTRPPEAAQGAPLLPFLVAGADAARWQRWQNELQMLFFEHAVNRRREADGQTSVDSLWFWGGGTPVPPSGPADRIFADGGMVCDLAEGVGVPCARLPGAFSAMPAAAARVAWLAPIGEGAQAQLDGLDRTWIAPALRALDGGSLSELELVLTGRALGLRFRASRPSLAQRWRSRLAPRRAPSRLVRLVAEGSGNS